MELTGHTEERADLVQLARSGTYREEREEYRVLECYSEIADIDGLKEKLPYKPYCSNDVKRGLQIRARNSALKKKYIELNPPHMRTFITFDLDYEVSWAYVADDVSLPQPVWCVGNAKNAHCHLIYVLDQPVYTTSMAHLKPLKYLSAIIRAYTEKLDADPAYTGKISKNPWSDKWLVFNTGKLAYGLDFLADYVSITRKLERTLRKGVTGLGRNCHIFETVRLWAYSEIRHYWGSRKSLSDWTEAVTRRCHEENVTFDIPLGEREIRDIARSISSWTWRHLNPDEFSKWQKSVSDKRWDAKKRERGLEMLAAGTSIRKVSQTLGVTERTCRNWRQSLTFGSEINQSPHRSTKVIKSPIQSDYQTDALFSTRGIPVKVRPWVELGISRSWYYHLKKHGTL